MARPRTNSESAAARPATEHLDRGEPRSVVRRAPFSDNPQVGARGRRTQQRILDAAQRVFGEDGYHRCNIDRITKLAGCSRVSFYQYFSSKEDVFRHLAGQVARELAAATEALGPLTPDQAGWTTLRTWVERCGDVYERYEAVFRTFAAAAETDEAVAAGSERTGGRRLANLRSRLATTTLPSRQIDPVLRLLNASQFDTHHIAGILRSAAPDAYRRERVDDAITDVVHRTLFGLDVAVNVHDAAGYPRPPAIDFGPDLREQLRLESPWQHDAAPLTAGANRTLGALVAAGREVFVDRGYHRTRVDDIVATAGVSHGAFYRYFKNKDHLAQVLAVQALRTVSSALGEIPDADVYGPDGDSALRRWLRRYDAAYANEAGIIRVWVDAGMHDPSLLADSAAVLDWGRRRLARVLRRREFGDVDVEAIVMLALLYALSGQRSPSTVIAGIAQIVERGLLAR